MGKFNRIKKVKKFLKIYLNFNVFKNKIIKKIKNTIQVLM